MTAKTPEIDAEDLDDLDEGEDLPPDLFEDLGGLYDNPPWPDPNCRMKTFSSYCSCHGWCL